jgi:hypothetical protein
MNNLAESYVAVNAFSGAKIWLERGISLAQNPNTGKRNKDQQVCDEACGILLFNLGMVFEVSGRMYPFPHLLTHVIHLPTANARQGKGYPNVSTIDSTWTTA